MILRNELALSGRVALVTGANHGIGAATARELARLGADVLIVYLRIQPLPDPGRPDAYGEQRGVNADAVVDACRSLGRRASALEIDLSDSESALACFETAERELGPVDILVNNASGWRKDTFAAAGPDRLGRSTERVSARSIDAQLLVDARATALLIGEFAERLARRAGHWGRIVSLTSGGTLGFPGEVSYGAAKAALENFTMSAALELADRGVTANVVHPPVTDTGWITPEVAGFVATSAEHTHIAGPDEVAEVIGWLCTDAARLVNANIVTLR